MSDDAAFLRDLQARAAIGRTITLYGQLLDALRFDVFGELFTEDAVWEVPGARFKGRDAIVEGLRAMEPDEPGFVKHVALTPVIDLDGERRARSWTDLLAFARSAEGWQLAAVGRYCDDLVYEDNRWRFAIRKADVGLPGSPSVIDLLPPPSW